MQKGEPCDNPTCQEAADRAVKKVFAILGVDVDKPESVEEFREDLRFGKKMRKSADHGFLALMGVLAAAASWLHFDHGCKLVTRRIFACQRRGCITYSLCKLVCNHRHHLWRRQWQYHI